MTDTQYLEEMIIKSGKKKSYLAERINLSRAGFLRKCKGIGEFTASEIKILCEELDITDLSVKEAIFFAL